ncbi:hypothetical protein BDQ17DRAFT_1356560 [Cyathus striatus]|nr:hypothetical protein BDQ17DRAFT_1356560 [Cyathus striatus]
MSRALGAAFLNHQVEQLEKTGGTGNAYTQLPPGAAAKRGGGPNHAGIKVAPRGKKAAEPPSLALARDRAPVREREPERNVRNETRDVAGRRRSSEEARPTKDADVVVVDASVLVHALYQVKKWCREGREEILIVPLEALNTLDLLKKGTSPLAQRARAASRTLEAQVGTNPRIRVQQDDAFVLWDDIKFKDDEADAKNLASPEWVRRTICCARWEFEHAEDTMKTKVARVNGYPLPKDAGKDKQPKVILALVTAPPDLSPRSVPLKLTDEAPLTPVPLPAPTLPHPNKHEIRVNGTSIAGWANKAGIEILAVDPTMPGRGAEDEGAKRGKGHGHHGPTGARRGSEVPSVPRTGGLVERPAAVMAMMSIVAQPSRVVRVLARGEKLDP